jgi:hypothetical protein
MQKVTVKTSDNSGTNGKLINLTASSVPLTVIVNQVTILVLFY